MCSTRSPELSHAEQTSELIRARSSESTRGEGRAAPLKSLSRELGIGASSSKLYCYRKRRGGEKTGIGSDPDHLSRGGARLALIATSPREVVCRLRSVGSGWRVTRSGVDPGRERGLRLNLHAGEPIGRGSTDLLHRGSQIQTKTMGFGYSLSKSKDGDVFDEGGNSGSPTRDDEKKIWIPSSEKGDLNLRSGTRAAKLQVSTPI